METKLQVSDAMWIGIRIFYGILVIGTWYTLHNSHLLLNTFCIESKQISDARLIQEFW
jgi:hypothetical protein